MHKTLRHTILFLGILVTGLGLQSFERNTETQKAYIDEEYFAKIIFEEVNKVRQEKGFKKLKWNPICARAAKDQAVYCARKGKLTHKQTVEGKKDVSQRFKYYKGRASTVGENLASLIFRIPNYQQGDSMTTRITRRYEKAAQFMVKLWMQSPPHRRNLLYDKFNKAGIGLYYTNKMEVFVGQVFSN